MKTIRLLAELEMVALASRSVQVFAAGVMLPVAAMVVVVAMKKFPVVNVPLVHELTTSLVIASAVPVHSTTAQRIACEAEQRTQGDGLAAQIAAVVGLNGLRRAHALSSHVGLGHAQACELSVLGICKPCNGDVA